ncbi:adenosylcobinamide-phosphate synthase CbiB [Roseomonas vastitatis]|uniref:Cobalamin biosynthesis protein CobD n=1 Tax=Teichococcus vastitatis TaxID=2307076 RepID=A0ABS9WCM7_9PROT|nr:adenosylcobinamide-phosphate synthase CbiB [Pseudoroseomonas vastitatis]MCI0757047.1 adenosylcobinamide-phosphate synthase CbiB [Pseudoroseomonas vastitatis]
MSTFLPLLLGALLIEAALGYPAPLFAAIRHPVVWMGALIGALDRRWNHPSLPVGRRRARGAAALLVLLLAVILPAAALQAGLLQALPAWLALPLLAGLAASLPAQRSLHDHVRAVAEGLERDGLEGGRRAVSMIVGRNPDTLDEAAVCRAAIESLAENFSDGVVAPAFWCAAAGLPGIAAYKAANTADSMIGHRTPRHEAFGWAAARFDDAVNLPASRLAALWIGLAALATPGATARGAGRAVRRDARRHRSPNAGWPEAAMAGALGLRLAGPRIYGKTRVEDAWMGDGRAEAEIADLRRALRLYRRACAIQLLIVAGLVLATTL